MGKRARELEMLCHCSGEGERERESESERKRESDREKRGTPLTGSSARPAGMATLTDATRLELQRPVH